jgi:hypothetical protein
MLAFVLVAVVDTLRLLMPFWEADSVDRCLTSSRPLIDLDSLHVRVLHGDGSWAWVRKQKLWNQAGHRIDVLHLREQSERVLYQCWTTDYAGNPSCTASVPMGPPLPPVSVPPLLGPVTVRWFDVSGRRILEPPRSGLYFEGQYRAGKLVGWRKVVKLR